MRYDTTVSLELIRNVRGRLVTNCRIDAVPSGSEIESDGARLINLAGDDLLALGTDARVRNAVTAALRTHGAQSAGGERLQAELESRAASLLGAEAAVLIDHEAALLSLLPTWRLLTEARGRRPVVDAAEVASPEEADAALSDTSLLGLVLEALRPLEGDLAIVPRYAEACQRHHTQLICIDDGLGVLGANGGGAIEHLSLQQQLSLHVMPLGGAIPGSGALVLGHARLIEPLRGVRPAPPAPLLAASLKALELSAAEPARRTRLFDVTQKLIAGLRARGFDTGPCVTPWLPVWLGDEAHTLQWLPALAELSVACRGWLAGAGSRLLLTPTATMTDAQANQTLDAFERLARKLPLPDSSAVPKELPTLARPGSYAMSAPAARHWSTVEPRERRPAGFSPHPQQQPPAEENDVSLRERVLEAVETLTWRATNLSSTQARRGADALRALLDKRRNG